jgi:hypothetical protein
MASAGAAKVAQTIVKYHLTKLASASEIVPIAEQLKTKAVYLAATSGYSDAKLAAEANYTERMKPYLADVARMLVQVAFGSSPTASEGSIDALTTLCAQEANAPMLYQTASGYLSYIVMDTFPAEVDKQKFVDAVKFFYDSSEEYAKGMAKGSNCLLMSGGGDVAVKDFLYQVAERHPVVVLDDGRGEKWNDKKVRPDNGSSWLAAQLAHARAGEPVDERLFLREKGALKLPGATAPYQPGDFAKYLAANADFLRDNVKVIPLAAPEDAHKAADDTVQFLKKQVAGVRFFAASHVNMDAGAPVVSNAQKFIVPVPRIAGGMKPVDKEGNAIVDYKNRPREGEGFVWYNATDKAAQFVKTDGEGVIIMNEVTEAQAKLIRDKIAQLTGVPGGDPAKLTLPQFLELMTHVTQTFGIVDCYDSSNKFINEKMNAMETSSTGIARYGLHRRDDKDVCKAIFVDGTGEFAGPALSPQQFENTGAIILQQGEKMRLLQPDVFFRTYTHVNGAALTPADVPTQKPRE